MSKKLNFQHHTLYIKAPINRVPLSYFDLNWKTSLSFFQKEYWKINELQMHMIKTINVV